MENKLRVRVNYFGKAACPNFQCLDQLLVTEFSINKFTLPEGLEESVNNPPDVVIIAPSVKDPIQIVKVTSVMANLFYKSVPVLLFTNSDVFRKLPISTVEQLQHYVLDDFYAIDFKRIIFEAIQNDDSSVFWKECCTSIMDELEEPTLIVNKTGQPIAFSAKFQQLQLQLQHRKSWTKFQSLLQRLVQKVSKSQEVRLIDDKKKISEEGLELTLSTINGLAQYFFCSIRWRNIATLSAEKINRYAGFFDQFAISKREQQVFELICKGKSNVEIAESLFISKRTVEKHRSSILHKTRAKNMSEVIAITLD